MAFLLDSDQFEILSDFFNDVAKGVMLAVIVGQGALGEVSGLMRLAMSSLWVIISLLFLSFALYSKQVSKEVKS